MEWYEELDYEENPFKDNGNIDLIGYEDVINDVLYRLEAGSIVCVEGKSGAGKTAILKAAINKFRGTGKLVYLNGKKFDNGLNIEKVFKKKAGLVKRLFKRKPKNMILLLDEVQNLSQKNCERLKYYFDNNFIKSAVLTSSNFNKANFTTSLKERVSKTIKLREMTEDEAIDVVQSRLGNDEILPEEVIKEVFTKSKRNMKLFLRNCENLCKFALENNGKKVMPEHVKEVLEETEKIVEKSEETKKETTKKSKKKNTKSKKQKSAEPKKEKKTKPKEPKSNVEEPITVSIDSDFRPQKKEVKMKGEFEEEEIDIDAELKKLSKANKLEDDDLEAEDYEESYDDFSDVDDEEEEELKKIDEDEDIAEKYY